MTIEPGEMLDPVEGGLTTAKMRAGLKAMAEHVDGQRVEAWLRWCVAGQEEREAALKHYRAVCREESRLLATVAEWEAAHPEAEE